MSMAVLEDLRGNKLTGADDSAATAYREGLTRFNLFSGDPIASAEAATASAPGFVMGHVLRAWLLLLSTEAPAQLPARESWLAARDLPMTTQEAGHVAAIGNLLDGRWHQAARVLEDVSIAHPRDMSHAQRDVLNLTLLEAAFRSGQHDLAKALTAERFAAKPASPLAALFAQRAHYRQYPAIS